MTCIKTQSLITPFINDELDMLTLEEFMNHINHCEECKEELEVYYTLLTGMKQLDDDKNLSGDFHLDFVNKLKKADERIKRKKKLKLRKRLALFATILVVGIITSISIKEYVVEDIMNSSDKNTVDESDIHLNYYFFKDRRSYLEKYMKLHYDNYFMQSGEIIKVPIKNKFQINYHRPDLKTRLNIHRTDSSKSKQKNLTPKVNLNKN